MTTETYLFVRGWLAEALAAGGPRGAALRGAGLALAVAVLGAMLQIAQLVPAGTQGYYWRP